MKKKFFAVLVLVVIAGGGVYAQNWYDSYAPGIAESKVFINAGVGYGFSAYSMGIPPIGVSVDFKLPIKQPITIGGTAAFSTWKNSTNVWGVSNSEIDVTYTNIGIGVRGAYHFNLLKNLDTYAGITLGYVIQKTDVTYGSAYGGFQPTYEDGASFILIGGNVGARYFFTKNIGAYLELGYSGLQVASIGLAVKF
jgi:opacity protein-like surface antigen